ncbi:hypothetical protein L873DRAFT_1046456 [Choiromyces venosus 120613-1]|uniref:Uncharacterized protein n=1 Tax=Choiromyces venosus 120613-1 TaxID=1336337 RepID=A0A3N4IWE1_9PEZI|nr:hypothetical protein L873DRAFT_1046456 [Choiromyces venosus 120613-1]
MVSRIDVPLEMGVYDIYCEASIQVSDEPWIYQLTSHIVTSREHRFHPEIHHHDPKCSDSGLSIPEILVQTHN